MKVNSNALSVYCGHYKKKLNVVEVEKERVVDSKKNYPQTGLSLL